ncbi:MAG: gliding motility-associated C-terminal domain-containing protein [Saprospiraceae bacterium]|nr:gliding motility-associated C-terminal domain-containing protein [Saprospiraceae bacterium]
MKSYDTCFIFFYCLFFLLLSSREAAAQNCEKPFKLGPVCGRIIDYDTGLPIVGAQIIGDPTCPISVTNSNAQGFYCLNLNCCSVCQNFPPIRYNNFVTVKAAGYCLTRTRPIFGHIDSVNFYLSRNCNCSRGNDSLVLVQMSNALNLNWPITQPLSNSQAWGGGSPGMFFSENLCVTGINMKPGYGVIANGTLPAAALSTLTGLEEFDSEGNDVQFLSGTLPDMSNFRNLNYFRLRKSKITGGVPASFGKLKNLSVFVVIQNPELRGIIPPEMGNMRELGVLHLYENNLTGTIPTQLGNLKKLYEVDIHTNNFSGTLPTGFGTCDSLRHFFADDCGLTGRDAQIDFMFRLPKIQYLGLSGNKFTGTIPKVPATPVNYNLSFINLNSNQFDSLPPLSSQRFYLSVKNNKLTFDDLLPNMTYLNSAGQNCVTDYQYSIGGYAPQDSIGTEKTIIATVGSTITIDELKIDGALTTNNYQWYRNGVTYGGVLRGNKLVIPNFPTSDTGVFVCRVTNPAAPLLTLNSRKITIKILACTTKSPVVDLIAQPICTIPNGSIALRDLPSTGRWTLTRSPDGVTRTGTGNSTLITGVPPGTYTYIVSTDLGCTSASTPNIVINAAPSSPNTPSVGTITQPTCTVATGNVVLNGLPSTGTWTLTHNDGVTTTGTGESTTITGLMAGTYTYTLTSSTGCTSAATSNIVINTAPSVPSTPSVGTITQPTCTVTTGSVVLDGLPSTGTWTLTRNPDGVITTGTDTSTTIAGLEIGNYTFSVTNSTGCFSLPTANIVINKDGGIIPSTPSIGTLIQPTCTVATGSVVLNGLPNTGTWTLTRNDGVTTTGTGVTTTITGLGAGTYTYTVTMGCTSSPTANIVITPSTGNPNAPSVGMLTQPTCTVGTGSVFVSGLPNTGTWTLTRSPDGVTTTGTGKSTTITGLLVGNYTYIVTNALGCTSVSSTNIVVNAAVKPETPIIGTITQPTCTVATSTVSISGLPATGTWILTRNPGAITSTGTATGTNISGLPAGIYTFTVTNAASCLSLATSNVVINAAPTPPLAPLVGTITMPPCDSSKTGSVVLSGLPDKGWTLTPTGGKGTGASTTVKNLGEGNYTFTVTNSDGCVSPPSIVVVTCKKNTEEKCLDDLVNQIPNGFTPGGNGVNDYFDPAKYLGLAGCSSDVKAEELYIINRWGEMIFKAQPYEKWDGRSSNQQKTAPTSGYYYILILKVGEVNKSIKGVINLFAD